MPVVNCEICGTLFEIDAWSLKHDKHHHCSRKCQYKAKEKKVEVNCANCGKILLRPPCRMKRTINQFCNLKCMGEHKSKTNVGPNHPTFLNGTNMVTKPCAQCGEPVTRDKSKEKRNTNFFCSRSCYDSWRSIHLQREGNPNYSPRVQTQCALCGVPIERIPSRVGAEKRSKHFCSPEHRAQWVKENLIGENGSRWKGGALGYYGPNWRKQQRAARKRDGYKCRACGISQKNNRKRLDVHHVVPFRDFGYIPEENENYLQANDLSNLVSLCRHCHMSVEAGNIPIQLNLL